MPSINDLAFKLPTSAKRSINDKWFDYLSGQGYSTPFTIASKFSTVSSPISSITGITSGIFSINSDLKVPANTLTPHSVLELDCLVRRNGTAGTNAVFVYLGTSNSTADGILFAIGGVPANDKRDMRVNILVGYNGTTLLTSYYTPVNGLGADNTFREVTTNINVASDMYINIGVTSANIADTFDLLGYTLKISRV